VWPGGRAAPVWRAVCLLGVAWDDPPAELGSGCGTTCRNYLSLWHQAGGTSKSLKQIADELRSYLTNTFQRDDGREHDVRVTLD
jgi:hypothetical protein